MDHGKLSVAELKKGLRQDAGGWTCNYCGQFFDSGRVYPLDGELYLADRAAARHVEDVHGGNLSQLLNSDSKYNTLTDNQRELLALFSTGMSDGEIAKRLGVAAATVRRQKFNFREKAKQARHYLAVFELVFDGETREQELLVPIPDTAKCVDDRYVTTEQERKHILDIAFESLEPLRLKAFSPKEKKKVVILSVIAEQFDPHREYCENEVREILKPIYADHATIRRYLIQYGFLDRTKDGSRYWLAKPGSR